MSEQQQQTKEDKVVQDACEAALHNEASALRKILKCRNNSNVFSSSLETPLLNSTQEAQILHGRLFAFPSAKHVNASPRTKEQILRALLMIPPIYESPWKATLQFVRHLQLPLSGESHTQFSRVAIRAAITEIHLFLQQTISAWWERRRRWKIPDIPETTSPQTRALLQSQQSREKPRDLILLLIQTLLQPLIHPPDDALLVTPQLQQPTSTVVNDDNWLIPLELLAAMVPILHNLDLSLSQQIMDLMFGAQLQIRSDRLLPWIGLVTDIHAFLRPNDWKFFVRTLQRKDDETNKYVAFSVKQDLPGLMRAIVSLSSPLLKNKTCGSGSKKRSTFSNDIFNELRKLALQLCYAASADPGTYSTVSTLLQGGASGFSNDIINEWIVGSSSTSATSISGAISESELDNFLPDWVEANLILALLGSTRKSASSIVASLLSRALADTQSRCDVDLDGWDNLVKLAYRNSIVAENKATNKRKPNASWSAEVGPVVSGLQYNGFGRFSSEDEAVVERLNLAGKLVYGSLFLDCDQQGESSSRRTLDFYVAERAQHWVAVATTRLKATEGVLSMGGLLLLVAIFVVVICEVPKSRSFVIREMIRSFQGEIDLTHLSAAFSEFNCQIVSIIARSKLEHVISPLEDFKPIIDVMTAGKLEKKTFLALIQALAPVSVLAQNALLSLSRKWLQSSVGCLVWDASSQSENYDRLQCSLVALSIISTLPGSNSRIAEAWMLLSESIVLNRPALPIASRVWLFSLLEEIVSTGNCSDDGADRLFRACLIRLLQYVGRDSCPNKLKISVKSAFSTWNTPDGRSVQCTPVEDLPGLLKLLFALFIRTTQRSCFKDEGSWVKEWHSLLLCKCSRSRFKGSMDGLTIDLDDVDIEQKLYCKVFLSIMLSMIEVVSENASNTLIDKDEPLEPFSQVELEHLETKIFQFEEFADGWLQTKSFGQNLDSADPPENAVLELASSLCDFVATALKHYRWSFAMAKRCSPHLHSMHKELVFSLNNLYVLKKEMLRSTPLLRDKPLHISGNDQETCFALGAFFVHCAVFLQSALSDVSNDSLLPMKILSLAREHMEALQSSLVRLPILARSSADPSPVVFGLWQLYSNVCDEEASVRFIAFLENATRDAEMGMNLDPDLHATMTPEEIDEKISQTRLSVLHALRICLEDLVVHGIGLKLFTCTPSLELEEAINDAAPSQKVYQWKHKPTTCALQFLMAILEKLSSDVETGIEGHSGGIPNELYMEFMNSIELTATLLLPHIRRCKHPATLSKLQSTIRISASKLQNAFCAFPPEKKKHVYARAFQLISSSLVRLARNAERQALLILDKASDSSGEFISAFAMNAFEQCILAVKEWTGPDRSCVANWESLRIPQKEESCQSIHQNRPRYQASDELQSTCTSTPSRSVVPKLSEAPLFGVPSVVTISVPNHTITQIKHTSEPQFAILSKQMCEWTLRGTLASMQEFWADVSDAMKQGSCETANISSSTSLNYVGKRLWEFHAINQVLSSLFEAKGTATASEKSLVDILPTGVKIRLCHLMHQMIASTETAMKRLETLVRQGEKCNLFSLGALEALSLVLGFCNVAAADAFDCVAYSRMWYLSEKASIDQPRDKRDEMKKEHLRYFPKILFRIEKVETTVEKFQRTLVAVRDDKERVEAQTLIRELDNFVVKAQRRFHSVNTEAKSLSVLVETKSADLVQNREQFLSQTHQQQGQDGHNIVRSLTGKRKRRAKYKRPTLRSRNNTIDSWLQSDVQLEGEEADDDAFLDLEDFLVDG